MQLESLLFTGMWKSRKWEWDGNWKQEMETGNRTGNVCAHCDATANYIDLAGGPLSTSTQTKTTTYS